VVEPPSRRLQQILLGLKLCSPRDLRRCASRVKVLLADLPAFDSVWLDALVQRRVLTSWQAQTIEADQPERLKIGPCVVENRVGQSHHSATYLAQLPDQKGQCVIKRVVVPAELRKSINDRLKQLIERSRELTHPGILVPHSYSEVSNEPLPELTVGEKLKESAATQASRQTGTATASLKNGSKSGVSRARRKNKAPTRQSPDKLQTELAIVSRLVDGLSLSEILLRRGRLPAADVDAIARQLLESLSSLHESGIVHGDILLSNIRLVTSGHAVLVDAGVRPALQPEFQINAHVGPEQNDGIAPELIGTGAAATPRSDLYALGFALWQLLAGRPAFPTGDPLAKLAAHQTERLPDIQEFAPDTPDQLAKIIEWLTEPVAAHRPRCARELLTDGCRDRKTQGRKTTDPGEKNSSITQSGAASRLKPEGASGNVASAQGSSSPRKSGLEAASQISIKPAGRASRRRLSRFATSFQQPLRRTAPPSAISKTAKPLACAMAATLFAIAALLTLDAGSRNFVLAELRQRIVATTDSATNPGSPSSGGTAPGSNDPGNNAPGQINAVTPGTNAPASNHPDSSSNPANAQTDSTDRSNGGNTSPASLPDKLRQHLDALSKRFPDTVSPDSLLPLPEPDPYGVVLLSEPGTYKAGLISWRGSHLTLRGLPDAPAIIMTSTGQPLNLRATEVTLENIVIHLRPDGPQAPTLTQIKSQKLTCLNCDFLTPLTGSLISPGLPLRALPASKAIQWTPIDAADPLAGELTFNNCRFAGTHSSILLDAPGRMVRCINTLKVGDGPLFIAAGRAASGDNVFELTQTTLRGSGSLIALDLRNSPPWKSRLTIKPQSSVFDLRRRSDGESESLITFVGGGLQLNWHERVSFEGDDSVASTSVGLASWQATNGSGHQTLDASEVSVRGLIQTEFTFRNAPSLYRGDSVLSDVQTNRISSQLPGISTEANGQRTTSSDTETLLIGPETDF
jgi:serine/threonine protein kinase